MRAVVAAKQPEYKDTILFRLLEIIFSHTSLYYFTFLEPKVPATQTASVDASNQGWWHLLSSFSGSSLAVFQDGRPLTLTWIFAKLRKLFRGSKLSKVQLKAKIHHWWAALCPNDLCCCLIDFLNEGHLVAEASHCHETTRLGCDRFRSRAQIAAMSQQ